MGILIPLVSVSAFWAIIGFGGPWIVPKGPNRGIYLQFYFTISLNTISGIIQLMIIMTAVCCWMFWIMVSFSNNFKTTLMKYLGVSIKPNSYNRFEKKTSALNNF